MIYQMIIKELLNIKNNGTEIGTSIKYCTNNIVDLIQMYDNGISVQELANKCIILSKLDKE